MAALSSVSAADGADPEPGTEADLGAEPSSGLILKRDPVIKLLNPVSGLEPLAWSEDHRLSVSCTSGVSVMDVVCDAKSYCPDLIIHRTAIPVLEQVCVLKVGPEKEVSEVKEKFATSKDRTVSQAVVLDRVMHPKEGALPPMQGIKYSCWSPVGCDNNSRCLLASLTLDNRLTVFSSSARLQWSPLVDLTETYGQMLWEKEFALPGAEPPVGPLGDLAEMRRRYRMQTPVCMEWSAVCCTQGPQAGGVGGTVLLAVLMENGDLVVWQFQLPFRGREQVVSCNTLQSGVPAPSALSWWEYEHGGRRMSGLIVGGSVGPVRILPVNLKAIKGYFTLRQPVELWQEVDQIPVRTIKCVSVPNPQQKCSCSLVLATRGPYLFWCLLQITKAGLNVHNSHVVGLHSTPIVSLAVSRHCEVSIVTCSLDGVVQKLRPVFAGAMVTFRQERLVLPEGVAGCWVRGVAVSPNSAYLALATTEGLTNGHHAVSYSHQVQLVALKSPETAATELLGSPIQNLFRQADLLDLSLQKAPSEARWRPSNEEKKVSVGDEEPAGDEEVSAESSATKPPEPESEGPMEAEVLSQMEEAELHVTREHMKKVLGEVYLNTNITENTSIPTRGLCGFLNSNPAYKDRDVTVLLGHLFKKMNKQTFPEYCSLCKEVLPFDHCKQAVCSNGHLWLRCALTYQACQSLKYRRCFLQDSVARRPLAEDPDWMKRILHSPCTFCDSPMG
ncbi:general transcription factor 3C polypeptide 4-like isoform X2 [Brienomyrus brachyistius]|uniref:general transcription factor 3C polypeptide 4-like isoform X2 n=1 Tax=Brienomyrus brachyistius TaxID=42636 RepID=UPI0020B2FFF4|nr:general transcription factor 3C polypeptide 4-like isoform X2 [Brienomyrus brachyistius]